MSMNAFRHFGEEVRKKGKFRKLPTKEDMSADNPGKKEGKMEKGIEEKEEEEEKSEKKEGEVKGKEKGRDKGRGKGEGREVQKVGKGGERSKDKMEVEGEEIVEEEVGIKLTEVHVEVLTTWQKNSTVLKSFCFFLFFLGSVIALVALLKVYMTNVKNRKIVQEAPMNENDNEKKISMEQVIREETLEGFVKNLTNPANKIPQVLFDTFEGSEDNNSNTHARKEEKELKEDRLEQILSNLDNFNNGMPTILEKIQDLLARHIKQINDTPIEDKIDPRGHITDLVKKRIERVVNLRSRYQWFKDQPGQGSSSTALLKLAKTYVRNTRYLFQAVKRLVDEGTPVTPSAS